jgi:hypothetical protein
MNNYNIWKPIDEIPYDDLYFFKSNDHLGKLQIWLKVLGNEDEMLEIKFNGVQAYRIVQESARLKSLGEYASLRKFRTSTDSEFLKWFEEESIEQFSDWGLVHYILCNIDNVIDVITGLPVSVEWVPCLD